VALPAAAVTPPEPGAPAVEVEPPPFELQPCSKVMALPSSRATHPRARASIAFRVLVRIDASMKPSVVRIVGRLVQQQQGHDAAESGLKIRRRDQNSLLPLTGHDTHGAASTTGQSRRLRRSICRVTLCATCLRGSYSVRPISDF
jgi:hypothetical protein